MGELKDVSQDIKLRVKRYETTNYISVKIPLHFRPSLKGVLPPVTFT